MQKREAANSILVIYHPMHKTTDNKANLRCIFGAEGDQRAGVSIPQMSVTAHIQSLSKWFLERWLLQSGCLQESDAGQALSNTAKPAINTPAI